MPYSPSYFAATSSAPAATTTKPVTITLIGMGLTGNTVFCQLVKRCIQERSSDPTIRFHINLIEKDPALFAIGYPYQTDLPAVWTLNDPAERFKLLPDDEDSLAIWMEANPDKWRSQFPDIAFPDSELSKKFYPRALAGLYLKDLYQSHKDMAKAHGISIQRHSTEIMDITPHDNAWTLQTSTGELETDILFVCVGHSPANHFPDLQSKPNFLASPYLIDQLKRIPPDAEVHYIGSQAGFTDSVRFLDEIQHHTGTLHSITRRHSVITSKGNISVCNREPVDQLFATLETEYASSAISFATAKEMLWDTYKQSVKNPIDIDNMPTTYTALTYQLAKYDKAPIDPTHGDFDETRNFFLVWYFSDAFKALWKKMDDTSKTEFNYYFYPIIFSYLTGITPVNAKVLKKLYDREQIQEHSGLTQVEYDDEQQRFRLHFSNETTLEATHLIDASGFSYGADLPLLRKMVDKGLIQERVTGGIEATAAYQAIGSDSQVHETLFLIGPSVSFGHTIPTPYAAFIARAVAREAVKALSFSPRMIDNSILDNTSENSAAIYSSRRRAS